MVTSDSRVYHHRNQQFNSNEKFSQIYFYFQKILLHFFFLCEKMTLNFILNVKVSINP